MRPATALQSDGPQNLADALQVAAAGGARGVLTVMAGRVHGPREVRKRHPYRLDAFGSGDGGPAALVEEGAVRVLRPWPEGEALGVEALPGDVARWPKVEIVTSHAAATGALVRALVGAGVDGLVVAGTGNGTVHRDLEAALLQAQARGVRVMRATRCAEGRVLDTPGDGFASAGELTPVKARVELMLQIIAGT
jgi:L-asparaginase